LVPRTGGVNICFRHHDYDHSKYYNDDDRHHYDLDYNAPVHNNDGALSIKQPRSTRFERYAQSARYPDAERRYG
jgi:hypothetical protein